MPPKRGASGLDMPDAKSATPVLQMPAGRGVAHTHADQDFAVDGRAIAVQNADANNPIAAAMVDQAPAVPVSPSSLTTREKFMGKMHVQRVGCNFDGVKPSPSVKLSFEATVVVVYPPTNHPERRYIIFMDETGSTGITVWNNFVHQFNNASIGRLVQITRMSINVFQAKKSLTMSRDSTVRFVEGPNSWWDSLLQAQVMSIIDIHSSVENTIVSVCGILGSVMSEEKIVRNKPTNLVIMRIVDRTGEIEIRSWNANISDFSRFR